MQEKRVDIKGRIKFRIKDEDREYCRLWNFKPQDVNCD